MTSAKGARDDRRGLPQRPFFYTTDQVATLLGVDEDYLVGRMTYFDGATPGIHRKDMLKAVNIAPYGNEPVYRIAEKELIRWMKDRRLWLYGRARS